jgi:hypothetical protein
MIVEVEPIKKFIETQKELIQIEREEEEVQLNQLLKETRIKDLALFGLCLTKLRIKKTKMGAFDKPVVTFAPNGFESSKKVADCTDKVQLERVKFTNNQKFSRGDLVSLYSLDKGVDRFADKPIGTGSLEKVEDYSLTVVFNESMNAEVDFFSEEFSNGMYCLVQAVNDVTYRR